MSHGVHIPGDPSANLPTLSRLEGWLSLELGPGIGVAWRGVDTDPAELHAVELEAVRRAVPRRQREFASGRLAARDAMARIGLPPQAIPSAPDRAPIWPEGVVGSIAHNAWACVAIAGRREVVHALGIDIEDNRPLEEDLWPIICTREELDSMSRLPPQARGAFVTRVFCAKEAYYKWQHPQTGCMLDFSDVQTSFNEDQTQFLIRQASAASSPVLGNERMGQLRVFDALLVAWLAGASHSVGPDGPLPLMKA